MKKMKHGFGSKINYIFDNFMSKGGFSVFMALMFLFLLAMIVMSLLRFIVNQFMPQENMEDITYQWWLAFLQIADGGAIGEETESNVLNRIVGILSLYLGLVLFSSLVAFITSQFEVQLEKLRKGKSNVIEKNHTLILGFGNRVLEIIRELIVANESEKNPVVVVLSEHEKDEMDDFFRDQIPNPKSTRIVTRSGSSSSIQLLRRVSVQTAKSIIVLNSATADASYEEKELADARVLKTLLAVMSCTGEENLPSIVVEIHLENKQRIARNLSSKIAIIEEHSILAKLMVQTSRISGLAQVYDHLVGFEGNEFYFYKPSEGFVDKTYGDLQFHFATCCVVGIRNADGTIQLNPNRSTVLTQSDEVILLAEDDSAIKYSKIRVPSSQQEIKPAVPQSKDIEKQLIVGWSPKASIIIDEYSKYLIEDSGIDLIVPESSDEMKKEFAAIQAKHPKIKMRVFKADVSDTQTMKKLKPEQYDNVIILATNGSDAELSDADTIAKLLEFRHYFKGLEGQKIKTQLITEVADSENIEIIQEAGVKDFLISNRFVSKIYAQVSEEMDVLSIYEDLFREEGSEVYLKPISLFYATVPASVSFMDLCAAASERNETCFGIRILAEEKDVDKHFGIYINPPKSKMFSLTAEDCLISLAEDES